MRRLLTALFLFTIPLTGWATPSQVVNTKDSLFGINATHLFPLRSSFDHMACHQPTQTDVMLIARNRVTLMDEQYWLVA